MSFDRFADEFAPRLWKATRAHRKVHHGGRPCPATHSPFDSRAASNVGRGEDSRAGAGCDGCVDEHAELLRYLWEEWVEPQISEDADLDLGFLNRREFIASRVIDLERKRRVERGYTARPDRTLEGKVFVAVLPDPVDREVLLRMVYFASSSDTAEDTFWPYRRVGEELGLPAEEVRVRFLWALDVARQASDRRVRRFVEQNIDQPVRDRGFGIDVPDGVESVGGHQSAFDEESHTRRFFEVTDTDGTLENYVVGELIGIEIARARTRLVAGLPAETVVADLVAAVFGPETVKKTADPEVVRKVATLLLSGADPPDLAGTSVRTSRRHYRVNDTEQRAGSCNWSLRRQHPYRGVRRDRLRMCAPVRTPLTVSSEGRLTGTPLEPVRQ